MRLYTFGQRQRILRPIEDVFGFFADAGNLNLLTPPWMHFEIRTPGPIRMRPGARIEYTIRWRGVRLRWLTEIEEWVPQKRFVDRQIRGPYRLWRHTHHFESDGDGTVVEDEVRYALPLGPLGRLAHALLVRDDVRRIFAYRAARIDEMFNSRSSRVPQVAQIP